MDFNNNATYTLYPKVSGWIGSNNILSLALDYRNSNIYIGSLYGKYGVFYDYETRPSTPIDLNISITPIRAGMTINLNASGSDGAVHYEYAVYNNNESIYILNWTNDTALSIDHDWIGDLLTFYSRGVNTSLDIDRSFNYTRNLNVTPVILSFYVYNDTGGVIGPNYPNLTTSIIYGDYNSSNVTTAYRSDVISGANTTYTAYITIKELSLRIISIYPNTSSIVDNSIVYNISYNQTDGLNIVFRNEETNEIMTDTSSYNITLVLIGPSYASNYTITDGTFSVGGLTRGAEYELRYSADGYVSRNYYVTITEENQALNIYLLANSSSDLVTATVYDDVGGYVENATINTLKYFTDCNCYRTVEISKTNFEGKTSMYVIPYTEWYRFAVYYGGVLMYYSGPTRISSDSITFQISLRGGILPDFFNMSGVTYILNYSNSTSRFYFNWIDSNSIVSQGCLDVYNVSNGSANLYGSSCTASSSGVVYVTITDTTNGTYVAYASIYNPTKTVLETISFTFSKAVATMGRLGLFLTAIILIVIGMAGIWNPGVMLILEACALIFTRIAGLNNFSWSIITVISALMIIMSYLISKRS
jgi:hypothetical protein